jgi:hypothetical protein
MDAEDADLGVVRGAAREDEADIGRVEDPPGLAGEDPGGDELGGDGWSDEDEAGVGGDATEGLGGDGRSDAVPAGEGEDDGG